MILPTLDGYCRNITVSIPTTGNPVGLPLCLAALLNAEHVPAIIHILNQSDLPPGDEFYMAQLAALAQVRKVRFIVETVPAIGVRAARQALLQRCTTPMLAMVDDDVLVASDWLSQLAITLNNYAQNEDDATFSKLPWAYGSKPDVNNRRGYPDFTTKLHTATNLRDYKSKSFMFWDKRSVAGKYAKMLFPDTGLSFYNVPLLLKMGLGFNALSLTFNSGGEDALFGMQCYATGLPGYFFPSVQSVHLEKRNVRFNEFAARADALLAQAALLHIDVDKFPVSWTSLPLKPSSP